MARTLTLEDLVSGYGQDWTSGIISEHLYRVEALGGRIHVAGTGRMWVAPAKGGVAIPVLCSEIVAVYTEDGEISGRCGLPALVEDGACDAHQAILEDWRAQSEPEAIAWEREVAAR